MSEDPRLGRFLAQWEKDSHEGITIRSVHNRVSGLQRRFDESEREFRERIARVEQNDQRDAEQRARDAEERAFDRAESTGRHAAILTPVQAFPVPGAGVTVNVGGSPETKKRTSGFWKQPLVTKAIGHGLTVAITAAVVTLLHWLSAATGVPIQATHDAGAVSADKH
jgi:hypothetical protein